MFADTFAEFFRHACQSAALLLPFSSSEERLYLEHIITRSRYSTWAFAATFNCPFLISELIFFKESLERDGQSSGETARFACAVCAFLVAFLLPWLRGGKVFPETLWALLVCADLALLLTRPVVIIDGRHIGQAARGTIAKLLVVCSFTFLPLRFFVALVVLTLGVIGSVFASYISGDMMDPLLLGLIGLAALYNLAVFEGQTRRAFRSVLTAQSVATQVFSEDFQRKISSSIQVASSDTSQELFPLSTPRPPQPRDNRDKRRHRSLPSGPTQEEGKWATAVQKFRSDGHEIKSSGIRSPRSGTESSVRRGRCHHSIEPAAQPDFIINVASEASEELLGSCILPSLPSQSRSISNYRNGQASSASPALPRPDGEAPRLGHASQRNSLSISKSSEGSQTAEISAVLPMVEVANAQSQTEILWKDGGWHCTRCSKPPAQPAQPAEPARLPAEMKRPQDRRRSRGQGSVASVEAWKKAMETLTHLQGNWQLVYGPENVSPWLERFMICGTTVSCEDVDRPLEMIEAAHPTLGGGILLLDKDEMLHRFGKSGQHLMFQRHDTTNLTSLVQRMNEDSDPQWFAPRAVSGEISSMQDLMDALEDAEKRDANVPHAGATPATSSQFH